MYQARLSKNSGGFSKDQVHSNTVWYNIQLITQMGRKTFTKTAANQLARLFIAGWVLLAAYSSRYVLRVIVRWLIVSQNSMVKFVGAMVK